MNKGQFTEFGSNWHRELGLHYIRLRVRCKSSQIIHIPVTIIIDLSQHRGHTLTFSFTQL